MMRNTHDDKHSCERERRYTLTLNHACGENIGMFCLVFFIFVLEMFLFSCLVVMSTFCALFAKYRSDNPLQITLPVKDKEDLL